MSARMGIDSKVYSNTGTYGSPTWVAIDLVRDVQVNPAWNRADGSSRASYVMAEAKTQLQLSFTLSVKCHLTDAGYVALMDSFVDPNGVLDLMILDGDSTTNGVEGWRFDAGVFTASQDQSIGNVLYRDFEVGPSAHGANAVKRVVVASGAPGFASVA